jgi:hypothetical protein
MGIFDIFFGGKNKQTHIAEQRPKIEMQIDEITDFISKKSQSKLEPFISGAEGEISQILTEFKEIGIIAKELSVKPVKTENPTHERIARQMKENYSERLPKILSAIKAPEKNDYPEIQKFHSQVVGQLISITKITSDNRYLPFFFKEEFEKLGEPVRRLATTVDALGKRLAESGGFFREGEGFRAEIGKIGKLKLEESQNSSRAAELEIALKEKNSKLDLGKKAELGSKVDDSIKALAELENRQSEVKSGITALVSPLERVLRKYEKITEEAGKIKIIDDFLKDQIGTLGESGASLKEFERVCSELKKALEEDRLKEDSKDKGKHLELLEKIRTGKLGGMLSELQIAENEKNNKKGEIKALKDAIGKIEGDEKNIQLDGEEVKKYKMLMLENQAEIEKTILKLEEGLGKWADCEIKIKRN